MAYLNQKLKTAIEREDEGTIQELLECGADPNAFLSGEDIAPVHLGPGISKSVTYLLLKYGGDPNLGTSDGITPLHIAATWGNKNIVKLLLRNGANIHVRDDEGLTPLDMAKMYEHEKCEIILKRHAHLLESQSNIQKRKVRQGPPSKPKIETFTQTITYNDRNFDASQDLFVDSDPEQHLSPVKRKPKRRSVLYRKEVQNQINHLCENKNDFHLDVTSPNHPCVTPTMNFHISSPKHIRAYTDPVAESTSTPIPIRPRRSMYTEGIQQKIDKYSANRENVGIDVTSPDHPELFFTPSAKSPINGHQKIQCETPIKSRPPVTPFKLEDSSDVGSSSSESDLYVTVNEAFVDHISKSPQNALDLDKLKHSMTHKIEKFRNCLNKLDTESLKPLMTNQPRVSKECYQVQNQLYSRSKEPYSGDQPSKNKLYSKQVHKKVHRPNHDVDIKFRMELPPKIDNGKSSRKHSRHPTIEMNLGESYDNEKSENRKSKREPVIDIQIQPAGESPNVNYKVRNKKELDPQIHQKSKQQHKNKGSHKERVELKSPEIQPRPSPRVRSKSAHENTRLQAQPDTNEYYRSSGKNVNGRSRQETYSYPGEKIYPVRLTHENQRGNERPVYNERIRQTHENQKASERPDFNERIRQTHENQKGSERPDYNERIRQTHENQKGRERPDYNERIRQTHENRRGGEIPEINERIHRLTHEDQRGSERPDPNRLAYCDSRNRNEKANEHSRNAYITKPTRDIPVNSSQNVTSKNYKSKLSAQNRQLSSHHSNISETVTAQSHARLDERAIRLLESQIIPEKSSPISRRKMQIFPPQFKINDQKNSQLRKAKDSSKPQQKPVYVKERSESEYLNCNPVRENHFFQQRGCMVVNKNLKVDVHQKVAHASHNEKATKLPSKRNRSSLSSVTSTDTYYTCTSELDTEDFYSCEDGLEPHSEKPVNPYIAMLMDAQKRLFHPTFEEITESSKDSSYIREFEFNRDDLVQALSEFNLRDPNTSTLTDSYLNALSHLEDLIIDPEEHNDNALTPVEASGDKPLIGSGQLKYLQFGKPKQEVEERIASPLQYIPAQMNNSHYITTIAEDEVRPESPRALGTATGELYGEFETAIEQVLITRSRSRCRSPVSNQISKSNSFPQYSSGQDDSEADNFFLVCVPRADDPFVSTASQQPVNFSSSDEVDYQNDDILHPRSDESSSLNPVEPDLFLSCVGNEKVSSDIKDASNPYSIPFSQVLSELKRKTDLKAIQSQKKPCYRWQPPENVMNSSQTTDESFLNGKGRDNMMKQLKKNVGLELKNHPLVKSQKLAMDKSSDSRYVSAQESGLLTSQPQAARASYDSAKDRFEEIALKNLEKLKENTRKYVERTRLNGNDDFDQSNYHSLCNQDESTDPSFYSSLRRKNSKQSVSSDEFPEMEPSCHASVGRDGSPDAERSCYTSVRRDESSDVDQLCYTSTSRDDSPDVERSRYTSVRRDDSSDVDQSRYTSVRRDGSPDADQSRYTSVRRDDSSDVDQSRYTSVRRDGSPDADQSRYTSVRRDDSPDVERSRYTSLLRDDSSDVDQSRYTSVRRDSSPDVERSRYISLRRDGSPDADQSRYTSVRRNDSPDVERSRYTSVRRDGSPDAESSQYTSVRRDGSPDAESSRYTSVRRDGSPDAESSRYTSVRRDSSPDVERSRYISLRRDGSSDVDQTCYTSVRRDISPDAERSRYTSASRDSSPDAERSRYTSVRRDGSAERSHYTSARRDSSPDADRSRYTSARRDSSPDADRSRYTSARRDSSPDAERSHYTSARRDSSPDAERSRYTSARRDSSPDAERSHYTSARRDSAPDAERSHYTSARRDSSPDAERSRYTSARRDSSPDAERSHYTSARRDSAPDAERSHYTSVCRDSSLDAERSCYTSVLREVSPDTPIKRSHSKSSRIPTLIDGQKERQQKITRSHSHSEPVTLQKRYITPQNNQSLYLSAQDTTSGQSFYEDGQSKSIFESVANNTTSSSRWQYVSTKSSVHNRSVTWQNPISTFDQVDAALVESTDDSTSWSPRKDHSPQTIPLTSTSASDEITSESISSDEFKRCLESKKLLSPEKRTTMWVNGIYKSNMQEYFDADISSIHPVINSQSSSSEAANAMKPGTTAANMKGPRIEPSAPPQSELISDGFYSDSYRCIPTAPPDISNTAVAGNSGERSGLSNSDYISLHPSLYPSLAEPCQNSLIKKHSEPQLEADAPNASSAAYVSFDSEPEPPLATVHCSPENARTVIQNKFGSTQKATNMCSVNIIPSVSSQVNANNKPLPCDSNLPFLMQQISKTISTQTPVLRIPPEPPKRFAPPRPKRRTPIKELDKPKRPQKGWAKLKKFFTGKKIQGQIGDKAFISVNSNQSFLHSCNLSKLREMSPPLTDTSGTQTDLDFYEPTFKQVEIVKSDEVSVSVNFSEQLSDYSEKYPTSIIPGLAENFELATQYDFLETCSSSGATSGSMERLLSPFCEDSNEDDYDEVDCIPFDTHPTKEDTEDVSNDIDQSISPETKICGETYKTQLQKNDKKRKSNDVEFLHIDPEMQIQFIERRISVENRLDEQSDDSESTELYDWKSFSKSVNDDLEDAAPAETKSVYWRTCGEKPDEAKTAPKMLKKPPGSLTDAELRQTLIDHGLPNPGPITLSTRQMYLKRLKNATGGHNLGCSQSSPDYNAELRRAMNEKIDWTEIIEFEEKMIKKFDNPKNNRKWREGHEKSSFNYLLLDPRVTKNLPSRALKMDDKLEVFRTFVKAIFYIGKGKRSRPYAHLYEAIKHTQGKITKGNEKISHIADIWNTGYGVVSLHCFQNVIPVEAYSREACMVDAIGCYNLTNKKRGDFYGLTATWGLKLKRRMGVYLLYKAMKIFLAEGERQIYPTDLH